MFIYSMKNKNLLTWNISLPTILTAEAGDPAGDQHHEGGGDSSDNQEKFKIYLTILTSKPGLTCTGYLNT